MNYIACKFIINTKTLAVQTVVEILIAELGAVGFESFTENDKGAIKIEAIDIDNWCYVNSVENIDRNNCKNITVF
jgi:hypothetical protein